ncbi:MAG: hypothetical protein ACM3PE_10005 [Deltaproteobacteria bacterium]
MKSRRTSSGGPVASRRGFFKSLVGQISALVDELSGLPQLSLADLPQLPDETMAQVKPLIIKEIFITVDDEYIFARKPGKDQDIRLIATDRANLYVFNLFNGILPLAEIAGHLAEYMTWDEEKSFDFTRNLFLDLVRIGVCVPGNSPDL